MKIKQTVRFKATPKEIYSILMDSKKHSMLTGDKASISKKVGGKFSVYSGTIFGKNLELKENKKIIQEWSYSGDAWEENGPSILTITLEKVSGGTKLVLIQENVPPSEVDAIKQGWIDYYWDPMKEMLK